jgi:hypothetical protein
MVSTASTSNLKLCASHYRWIINSKCAVGGPATSTLRTSTLQHMSVEVKVSTLGIFDPKVSAELIHGLPCQKVAYKVIRSFFCYLPVTKVIRLSA